MLNKQTEERLARSLTADSTEIIPYLPYLLQDFWEIGSSPEQMIELLERSKSANKIKRVLDLGCGKGAVSIMLAEKWGYQIKGYDILPAFIEEADAKAAFHQVSELVDYQVMDINEAVKIEQGYDCVIWGAVGDVLGDYPQTLAKVSETIRVGGYILFDDAYVEETQDNLKLRMKANYPTLAEWKELFANQNLKLIDYDVADLEPSEPESYLVEYQNIVRRADELADQYPDKKILFENYKKSQLAEYQDLEDLAIDVLWLLQK